MIFESTMIVLMLMIFWIFINKKTQHKIMLVFIRKTFIGLSSTCIIGRVGKSLHFYSKGPTKCVSLNNQPSKTRPTLVNINFDETLFYLFTVRVHKCGGSSNKTDDTYWG